MGDYEERRLVDERLRKEAVAWVIKWGLGGCSVIGIITIAIMFAYPLYNVWAQGLSGKAALNRAEQTRQIQIEQAKGEEVAAIHRANAIKIIGQAAKDFPEYRYQEFLGAFGEALHNGNVQKIVFIPTEAQIPITEAGRSTK